VEYWNKAYASEATAIAAAVIEEQGQRWLADQVRRGRQPKRPEIRIAMRALMVARGELELARPYF
jgi:hypothetical protein